MCLPACCPSSTHAKPSQLNHPPLPPCCPSPCPLPCRRDEPVRDSKGVLREDSAGAATRRRFVKLPGVGCKVAKDWWDRGLR